MQVSGSTWELVKHLYSWQPTGGIAVKGKGTMHTYLLEGQLGDSPMEVRQAPAEDAPLINMQKTCAAESTDGLSGLRDCGTGGGVGSGVKAPGNSMSHPLAPLIKAIVSVTRGNSRRHFSCGMEAEVGKSLIIPGLAGQGSGNGGSGTAAGSNSVDQSSSGFKLGASRSHLAMIARLALAGATQSSRSGATDVSIGSSRSHAHSTTSHILDRLVARGLDAGTLLMVRDNISQEVSYLT